MTAHTDDWRGETAIRSVKSGRSGKTLFSDAERAALRAEILRLHGEGMFQAQIARRVGISQSKVWAHIKAGELA